MDRISKMILIYVCRMLNVTELEEERGCARKAWPVGWRRLVLICHQGDVPPGLERVDFHHFRTVRNQLLFHKFLFVKKEVGSFGFAKVVGIMT